MFTLSAPSRLLEPRSHAQPPLPSSRGRCLETSGLFCMATATWAYINVPLVLQEHGRGTKWVTWVLLEQPSLQWYLDRITFLSQMWGIRLLFWVSATVFFHCLAGNLQQCCYSNLCVLSSTHCMVYDECIVKQSLTPKTYLAVFIFSSTTHLGLHFTTYVFCGLGSM